MAYLTNQLQPLTQNCLTQILDSYHLEKMDCLLWKPKAGQVYVVKAKPEEQWKYDGFKWSQYKKFSYPSTFPQFTKTSFQIILPTKMVASKEFQKHVYRPLKLNCNILIIHYMGQDVVGSTKIATNSENKYTKMFQRYNDTAKYLKDKDYLHNLNQFRRKSLLQNIKYFELENDQLFYKSENGKKMVVLSDHDVQFVIKDAHESTNDHLSKVETCQAVAKDYYWKTILVDINKMVKSCRNCSGKVNANDRKIWTSIKINLIGPLSIDDDEESRLKNSANYATRRNLNTDVVGDKIAANIKRYVFAAIDFDTSFLYVDLLSDVSSMTILSTLLNMFMELGCPHTISIFQPEHFIQQLKSQIEEISEFRPQIIRLSDNKQNFLKTETALMELLASYIAENDGHWHTKLKAAVFGINASYDETIQTTPYQLFMNR